MYLYCNSRGVANYEINGITIICLMSLWCGRYFVSFSKDTILGVFASHMRRSGPSTTHFRYPKNQKWPSYTLTTGRKNEKMEKVADQFPACLRHIGN